MTTTLPRLQRPCAPAPHRPALLPLLLMAGMLAGSIGLHGAAFAKVPPLSPEAKAKADEAAAKTAWNDKVAAYQLCQVQDSIAARFKASTAKPALAASAAAAGAAPAAAAASAPVPVASGASPVTAPAVAAAAAIPTLPACTDPGPFAYTPPEQKPLEAAGAHSPPQTAATPPNTAVPQGQIAPAAAAASVKR